jgi:hypothetical protein
MSYKRLIFLIVGTHQSGAEILVRTHRLRSHSESGNSSMDEKEIERLQVIFSINFLKEKFNIYILSATHPTGVDR